MKKIITNTAIDYYRKNCREAHFIPIESISHPFSEEESVDSILNTKDIISRLKDYQTEQE